MSAVLLSVCMLTLRHPGKTAISIRPTIRNLAISNRFLADRTNGRAIGTVLRLSVVCL